MKDKYLGKVGDYFENANKRGDKTFQMLYDMNKLKVEEYILLPYLIKLLSSADDTSSIGDRIWLFMQKAHPEIVYSVGQTDHWYVYNNSSFIINFIEMNQQFALEKPNFPLVKEFVVKKFITVEDNDGKKEVTIELTDVELDDNGDLPTPTGWFLKAKLEDIKINSDLYNAIISNSSPFYAEYEFLENYKKELISKYSCKDDDDIFDCM